MAAGSAAVERQALAVRLALDLAAVACAGYLPDTPSETREAFAWAMAAGAIPFHTILYMAALGGLVRTARGAGVVGELGIVFLASAALPAAAPTGMLVMLVLVGLYTYLGGRGLGVVTAAGGLLVAAAADLAAGEESRVTGLSLVVLAIAAGAIVLLVERAAAVERRVTGELDRMRHKGDAVLAHIADGVVVTDAGGRVLETNPAASRLFDGRAEAPRARCEELLGLHLGSRALDCSKGCPLLEAAVPGEVDLGIEVWRPAPDGRRQPLLASVSAITGDDGQIAEVVHSLRDVTRLKQAEEAKTLFLATASHELKTPLTVIQGFAQTLLLNPTIGADEQRHALEAIERRAAQLAGIVDRLLLSSRIEAGRVQVATRALDVGPLLAERVRDLAAATGRSIELSLPPDAAPVLADESSLITVIDHLLDNAVKYSTPDAPIAMSVEVRDGELDVTVRDRGIGMSADQLSHCFDKFWQAEAADSRRYGGTGIGLYIVRSLVEGMGGTIRAESALGRGTAFVITLLRPRSVQDAESVILEVIRHLGVTASGQR